MYRVTDQLLDLEKVFNYLDGGITSDVSLINTLKSAEKKGVYKNIDCKFFSVSFFKKGTCHIVFKDIELLKKFNIFGSQRKGWLPPSYGKKSYSNMEANEKSVIDEFEGEESYNRVMQNKDYYITDCTNILSLTA